MYDEGDYTSMKIRGETEHKRQVKIAIKKREMLQKKEMEKKRLSRLKSHLGWRKICLKTT